MRDLCTRAFRTNEVSREPEPLREPVSQQSLQHRGISVVLLARLGLVYSRKPIALAGAERASARRGARAY